MNKLSAKELFITGERLCREYFERRGFQVLAQNFRKKCGEIDLVVRTDEDLIFVEVKTRSYHSMESALANVSYTKQKKISRTSLEYINLNPEHAKLNVRYDIIVVFYYPEHGDFALRHLENAFLPIFD